MSLRSDDSSAARTAVVCAGCDAAAISRRTTAACTVRRISHSRALAGSGPSNARFTIASSTSSQPGIDGSRRWKSTQRASRSLGSNIESVISAAEPAAPSASNAGAVREPNSSWCGG